MWYWVCLCSGELPFSCTDCPKRFLTKHALFVHKPVHTQERRHVCAQCSKTFTQNYRYIFLLRKVFVKKKNPAHEAYVENKFFVKKFMNESISCVKLYFVPNSVQLKPTSYQSTYVHSAAKPSRRTTSTFFFWEKFLYISFSLSRYKSLWMTSMGLQE